MIGRDDVGSFEGGIRVNNGNLWSKYEHVFELGLRAQFFNFHLFHIVSFEFHLRLQLGMYCFHFC